MEIQTEEAKYFRWLLLTKLELPKASFDKYEYMLVKLWHKEFYSNVLMDSNRTIGGRALRMEFGLAEDEFGVARVLEVLVHIALKGEFMVRGSRYKKTSADLFFEMLKNLDLLYFDNRKIIENPDCYIKIDEVLTKFLGREYGDDGKGSIFPLKKPAENYSGTELWYQLQAYFMENYPFKL